MQVPRRSRCSKSRHTCRFALRWGWAFRTSGCLSVCSLGSRRLLGGEACRFYRKGRLLFYVPGPARFPHPGRLPTQLQRFCASACCSVCSSCSCAIARLCCLLCGLALGLAPQLVVHAAFCVCCAPVVPPLWASLLDVATAYCPGVAPIGHIPGIASRLRVGRTKNRR